jgi:hypothetical protein
VPKKQMPGSGSALDWCQAQPEWERLRTALNSASAAYWEQGASDPETAVFDGPDRRLRFFHVYANTLAVLKQFCTLPGARTLVDAAVSDLLSECSNTQIGNKRVGYRSLIRNKQLFYRIHMVL